jgi:hypothetical protein
MRRVCLAAQATGEVVKAGITTLQTGVKILKEVRSCVQVSGPARHLLGSRTLPRA